MRPIVVLAVDDLAARGAYAYGLYASGFDVIAPADPVAWSSSSSRACRHVLVASVAAGSEDDWAFVQRFKADPRTRHIPIIAMTADTGDATRSRAGRAGCAAVCINGCAPDVLAAGLRALLHEMERARARLPFSRPA